MVEKVGIVGFGNIGSQIAKILKTSGYNIKVWDRDIQKIKEKQFPYTNTLEGIVLEQDLVITTLSDNQAVEEIYSRIYELSIKEKIFINMTTVRPETSKKIAENIIKKQAIFLESPILTRSSFGENKLISIAVSGDETVFNHLKELFYNIAENVFYVGDYTNATIIKLINDGILSSFMGVLSEGIVLAENLGIDRDLLVNILDKSSGKSFVLQEKKEKLLKEDYKEIFSVKHLLESLKYLNEISDKNLLVSPYFSTSINLYKATIREGFSDNDFCSIIETFKKLNSSR